MGYLSCSFSPPFFRTANRKDPGIPNEFPYKDRILAEVAEQRRMVSLTYVVGVPRADWNNLGFEIGS